MALSGKITEKNYWISPRTGPRTKICHIPAPMAKSSELIRVSATSDSNFCTFASLNRQDKHNFLISCPMLSFKWTPTIRLWFGAGWHSAWDRCPNSCDSTPSQSIQHYCEISTDHSLLPSVLVNTHRDFYPSKSVYMMDLSMVVSIYGGFYL